MPNLQAPLVIRPLQWASLPELHDTAPLDDTDRACMDELRAVLARHGKLGRFALHLAHRHFELAPGEVLIERSDPAGRSHHVTVGRLDQVEEAVPTTWMLDDAPDVLAAGNAVYCICVPVNPAKFSGCMVHGKSSSPGEVALTKEALRQRRIAEEKARYERGFPAGGHGEGEGRER